MESKGVLRSVKSLCRGGGAIRVGDDGAIELALVTRPGHCSSVNFSLNFRSAVERTPAATLQRPRRKSAWRFRRSHRCEHCAVLFGSRYGGPRIGRSGYSVIFGVSDISLARSSATPTPTTYDLRREKPTRGP